MNWFDLAILGVIGSSALQGRGQGAVRAFLPLIGVIVATLVAGLVYVQLAESISTIVTDGYNARVIAFLALFGAVYFASHLLSAVASPFVALLLLAPWIRTLGLVWGAVRGLLLVNTLVLFLVTYPSLGLEGGVDGSKVVPFFVDAFSVMHRLLPEEFDAAAAAFQGERIAHVPLPLL